MNHFPPLCLPSNLYLLSDHGTQYDILDNITETLPLCKSHFQSGVGFWRANYWVSMVCRTKQWYTFSAERIGRCLQNKDVYFLGDSTTRQWAYKLLDLLNAPVDIPKDDLTFYFKYNKYFEHFNLNITFQFHPHFIGLKEVNLENEMYEVDVIDGLQCADCNFVVIISPWAHFAQWWADAYVERLRLLRASVERLKKRCPGVKIVLKGPHPRNHGGPYSLLLNSDYIIFKVKEAMEEVFRDADVYYINVWDLNNGYKGENMIHMPPVVIQQEVSILLSYLCTDP